MIDNSKTIKLSIESIHNSLEDLHQLLLKMHKKSEYHKTLFFNNWRTIDFSKNIEDLKLLKKTLDNRFNILQQIKLDL